MNVSCCKNCRFGGSDKTVVCIHYFIRLEAIVSGLRVADCPTFTRRGFNW